MFAPRPKLVRADVSRRAQTEKEQLVRELNESGDGRLKVSSPYILVIARVGSYMTPASPPPGRASRGRPPHTAGRREARPHLPPRSCDDNWGKTGKLLGSSTTAWPPRTLPATHEGPA